MSKLEHTFWKWKIYGNKKKVKMVVNHLAEHSRISPYSFFTRVFNTAKETLEKRQKKDKKAILYNFMYMLSLKFKTL